MPNHIHLLVTLRVPFAKWLGPLKGFRAHRANELLGRTGGAFWQDESYDRLVRSDEEFERIRTYIKNNPATAGLAASPEEFPWSSAAPGRRLAASKGICLAGNLAGLPPG